jgi:hypothetical protein
MAAKKSVEVTDSQFREPAKVSTGDQFKGAASSVAHRPAVAFWAAYRGSRCPLVERRIEDLCGSANRAPV